MAHRDVSCVVVEGRYSHVSFILNAAPLVLRVLDIVPPFPSKLLDQVHRVLETAESLPPVVVEPILVNSCAKLAEACEPLTGVRALPSDPSLVLWHNAADGRYLPGAVRQ
jgi:hypothetical protein